MIETRIENPERLETLRADGQGRISLGVEYADRIVEIVVVDSEAEDAERTGVQQTIGDGPMNEHERRGMVFVRLFGIDPDFLRGKDDSEPDADGVDPETVRQSDVDWSEGYLLGGNHAARFDFSEDGGERPPYSEQLTATPIEVTADDDTYGEPVYRYENENGDTSAVSKELVEKVRRLYGYDPVEDRSNVRVHPEEGAHPVLFHDASGDTSVAIAPLLASEP